ncbi:3-hydroxyacyl-[acyl-carrier-protein] dehydratase FabZ [mine drainage metagenome]|uniref:3-hydroxyacyl-[acyl-carrier-protein] dehydratase FabZ n=1 Tax=mine drainage metagenome TaxID=410659 RepID=A0A1J5SD27_9ZZZZ
MNRLTLPIAANHPTGAGHFPGNPIIPGALLLAEVLARIGQAERLQLVPGRIKAAKFLHPVRPGDTVEIEYERSPQGAIEFQCAVAGTRVLTGGIVAGR